jgi:hypothetical protein
MSNDIFYFLIGFSYGMAIMLIIKKFIETFKKD